MRYLALLIVMSASVSWAQQSYNPYLLEYQSSLESREALLNRIRSEPVPAAYRLGLRKAMRADLYANWETYSSGTLPLGNRIMEYLVLANGAEPLVDGLEHSKELGLFSTALRAEKLEVIQSLLQAFSRSAEPPEFLFPALQCLFSCTPDLIHPDEHVRNLARTHWVMLSLRHARTNTHATMYGLQVAAQTLIQDSEEITQIGFRYLIDALTHPGIKDEVRRLFRDSWHGTPIRMGELIRPDNKFYQEYLLDAAVREEIGKLEFVGLLRVFKIPVTEISPILSELHSRRKRACGSLLTGI